LQLAWLGDAVWELHQRLRQCRQPGRSADLHRAVVAEVRADAQAAALDRLEQAGLLTDDELELVRKGRNRAGRGPRRGNRGSMAEPRDLRQWWAGCFCGTPAALLSCWIDLRTPTHNPFAFLP
jgi:ribonuclease-3 family protein